MYLNSINNNHQKVHNLNFSCKVPKKVASQISDDVLKKAAIATAAVGLAGIAMNRNNGTPEDLFIKDALRKHIGREVYIVTKNNFIGKPKEFERYMNYHTGVLLKDGLKLDSTKFNHIRNLLQEIVMERVKDKSKPEDFSDIEILPPSEKSLKYADLILTEELLKYYAENDISQPKIAEITGFTPRQVRMRMEKFGVFSKRQRDTQRMEELRSRKAEVEQDVQQGLSIEQIGEKYGVSATGVFSLLKEFELETEGQKRFGKLDEVSDEEIIDCWKKGMTTHQMAAKFGVSPETVSARLKKMKLQTKRQSEIGKYDDLLTKENLREDVAAGMNSADIAKKYGCSQSTAAKKLRTFQIMTEQQAQNARLAAISDEEIKACWEQGMSLVEMADYYNCSLKPIKRRLKKMGLQTKVQTIRQYNLERVDEIKLQEYVSQGLSVREIAEKFEVSSEAVRIKLLRMNLKTKYAEKYTRKELGDKYEDYSIEDLSLKILDLICGKDVFSKNQDVFVFVDMLCEKVNEFKDKNMLVKLLVLTEQVANGKKDMEELIQSEDYNNITSVLEKLYEKDARFDELQNRMNDTLQKLSMQKTENLLNICSKYYPDNNDDKIVSEVEYIINTLEENKDNLLIAERKLVYWDAKNEDSDLLQKAEEYSKDMNGKINAEKAGQYIINANILENYIATGETFGYPERFLNIMKTSPLPKQLLIRYLIKIENWMRNEDTSSINTFLKNFNINDGDVEKAFIKAYIEDFYLTCDTKIPFAFENGQKHEAVFAQKAKQEIVSYNKFPNCVDKLAKFEDVMHKATGKIGDSGIKACNNGKMTWYEVKIFRWADRLYSSNNDLRFDIYEPQHD